MVVIYTSTTVPINSSNDTDPLTSADFWKVLEHKCRNPVAFVKPITACRIIREEHDDQTGQLTSLTRAVTLNGEEAEIEEVAVLKKPVMVSFTIPSTGTLITNILSRGAEEADIYMVSTYEWHHPYVEEGSDEHEMLTDYYWKMSSETVKHTVDIAKQLSREGKIANL
ncbi:hypothetical protein TCE0_034r11785 [Talaromyces pinophilus]|uniref:DUF1857-domain-containing protein n=1 Tax=Talaromyces pinophilus TaxID=128442 RepID=A0A6V8HEG8_TALPI|nr:hypothetical protein TCE0_034r11785 [Talaromyces pinophilus]